MSAPVVISTAPAANEPDVVLGRPVQILFDQAIDPATVSSQTFSLMGPGQTSVVAANEFITKNARPVTGREYIPGLFSFPAPGTGDTFVQNQSLIFTPSRSLRPDVVYTVLLTGQSSVLATCYIANPDGQAMASSLQYSFTTGQLDLKTSPPLCPMPPSEPWEVPKLYPRDIVVRPRLAVGNDLTQEIDLIFPAPISPSFDPNTLIIAGEPFLNDPTTEIPPSVASVLVSGNTLRITVSWGAQPPPPVYDPYSIPGESGPVPTNSDFGWMEPENNPMVRRS